MIIAILFIFLIWLGVGLPLTLLLIPKGNDAERAGLSFPLGVGIFTLAMFLTNLAGFKFTFVHIIELLAVFSLPLISFQRKLLKDYFRNVWTSLRQLKLTPVEKTILGLILFLVISSFINTFYWPIYSWDTLVLYDFRAKIFAQAGFIGSAMINHYYYSYPLLTSLIHTIVYLSGGNNPQFIYSFFYLALGLSFYGLVREFFSRRFSLICTLILLSVPLIFNHSLISYTNLPYTVYLSLGAILFYVRYKRGDWGYLILSSIFVGLSAWTRSIEPYWLVMLAVVFLGSILKRRFLDIIVYSLFLFPIQRAWGLFRISTTGMAGDVESNPGSVLRIFGSSLDLTRWEKVLTFINQNVIQPWGAIFVFFVFAAVFAVITRKMRSMFMFFMTILMFFGFLLVGTFMYSFLASNWFALGDAATRTSMIFYPLFVYLFSLVLGNYMD